MQLHELTIQAAHELLKSKEISSRELTQAVLDRIEAVESQVDAFITVTEANAIQAAETAAKREAANTRMGYNTSRRNQALLQRGRIKCV